MPKIIDANIQLPILVERIEPNPIIVPKPTLISKTSGSIEVEQTFQCDVDYYGGVGIEQNGDVDAKLVKNPNTMTATLTGLSYDTEYTIKGVGLSILGNETISEGLVVRTKASPIPYEYQLVEWIKSNGGYFNNIPIVPDNLTDYELYFKIDSLGFLGSVWVVGSRVSYGGRNNCLAGSWNYSADAGWEYNGYSTFPMVYGQKVYFKSAHGKLYFNDNLVCDRSSQYSISWNAGYNCGLFCKGGEQAGNQKMTFYDFLKIRHNDELVYDLYPVYRKSDNYVGLYCIVTNQFIPSVVNSFTVGPNKEWE